MINFKKIVIWALVLVNVSFLAFFLWRLYKDQAVRIETLQDLSALFDKNGIYMNTDNIREGGELAVLQMSRDITAEQKMAEALLGQLEVSEQNGVYYYTATNGKGEAEFSASGRFHVTFNAQVYGGDTGAKTTAKSILKTMDVETFSLEESGEAGNETVTAVCSWKNQPIFNCRIAFNFKEGYLFEISGRHTAGIEAVTGTSDMSSCATALMHFLNAVKSDRYICTQIIQVEPGYMIKTPGDIISAVWRVETDGGAAVYFVNASTGDITTDAT